MVEDEPRHGDDDHARKGHARPGEEPGRHDPGLQHLFEQDAEREIERGQERPAPQVDGQVAAHLAVVLARGVAFDAVARGADVAEQPVEEQEAVQEAPERHLGGRVVVCNGMGLLVDRHGCTACSNTGSWYARCRLGPRSLTNVACAASDVSARHQ